MKIEYIKNLKLTGTALAVTLLDDQLILIDSTYVLYKLDKNSFKMLSNKKITTKHKKHHQFHKGYSNEKELQLVTLGGTNNIVLLDASEGIKKLGLPEWHETPVEVSILSHDKSFFVTGSQNGKVLLFDTKTVKLIDSLPQKPDYISNLCLSNDDSILISNCFNHSTMIYNIHRNELLDEFITDEVVQEVIIYKDEFLFMVCRDGNAHLYSMQTKEILSTEHYFEEWPSAIALSKDKEHAIIGVRDGSLHIINIKENRALGELKTRNVGISKLGYLEDKFYIAYADGIVQIADALFNSKKFENAMEEKDFNSTSEILEENILLQIDPIMELFNDAWQEEILELLTQQIQEGKLEDAAKLAGPFLFDSAKKKEYDELVNGIGYLKEFNEYVEKKNYKDAYALAVGHPELKSFSAYHNLEVVWDKTFAAVKKLMEANPALNRKKCDALLAPFSEVREKKDRAMNILVHATAYFQAEDMVRNKDFGAYSSLIKRYAFLKETDLYVKVDALGHRLLEKINALINEAKFVEAEKLIKSNEGFSLFRKQLDSALEKIEVRTRFSTACHDHDLMAIYKLIDQHSDLAYLESFIPLEEEFKAACEEALPHAHKGSSEKVISILSFYLHIPYRRSKASTIAKIAYLNELKYEDDEAIDWKKSFKNYLDRFGLDSEISSVAKSQHKLDFLKPLGDGNKIGYLTMEFHPSILYINID
jgi:hypothetical protein